MTKLHLVFSALALVAGTASAGELHVFTSGQAGFNTHSVWYDDGKEVTVVDTQFTPAIAQDMLNEIKQKTKSPVTRLIVTHANPDKFNALSVFNAMGVETIASTGTAAAMPGADKYKHYFWVNVAKTFTDETYPKFEAVKTTYTGKKVIKLKSGETITLFELSKPGVSSDQTVVRFDKTGDLVVGDLVASHNHAWLEGGIVDGKPAPAIKSWISNLKELPKLGHGKVYGGRGDFLPVKEAAAQEVAYLQKADAIVDSYINNLGDKRSELSDPTKQSEHYAQIQAEFAKELPDYAMPDLISYSVYGLVNHKLTESK
ncbi:MBL fold metallo-hydrolase [Ralstonia solanacearum species complex bacterium KE056]|uniref:MBL fold metallo-hydrolase n=1 Tax=Ralstonia solanacearum species complex bacterium KE056 TaxID=3119585 RepID=UPI002FC39B88